MWASLLIMAAGMWSRYGWLKQIDWFGPNGETILEYSIYDAIRVGFDHVVLVIRESFHEQFKEVLWSKFQDKIKVDYVFQEINPQVEWFDDLPHREKPRGTGHAVLAARDAIDQPFCVINADDYYWVDGYRQMLDWLSNNCKENTCSMIWYVLKNTLSENWTVNRWICEVNSDGKLLNVAERLKIERNSPTTVINPNGHTLPDDSIVSMNFWWFHQNFFWFLESEFHTFLKDKWGLENYEFYIPAAANSFAKKEGNWCDVMVSQDRRYGVTYADDKKTTQDAILGLVESGVYPNNLWD